MCKQLRNELHKCITEATNARDEAVAQARRVAEVEAALWFRERDLSKKDQELDHERAARSEAENVRLLEEADKRRLADELKGVLQHNGDRVPFYETHNRDGSFSLTIARAPGGVLAASKPKYTSSFLLLE